MISEYTKKLLDIYIENNNFNIVEGSPVKDILARLFLYYQHYNADETSLDELESHIIDSRLINAIIPSHHDEDTYDCLHIITETLKDFSVNKLKMLLSEIDKFVAEILSNIKTEENAVAREKYKEFDITDDKNIKINIIYDLIPDHDTRSIYKEIVTNFKSIVPNMSFIIYFGNDLLELIQDIESPTIAVKSGKLVLVDRTQYLIHGEEKSIVTSISAKSLKEIYLKHGTNGLFSSNLRYYVKSAKIDLSIKNSILHEPEKFWYFNNGIIITCEDYDIVDNEIFLSNFSIVNGGQTTNLIGNTVFDKDFSLICKIIKNKYQNPDQNLEFLLKIAETSNTQKPIKTKDIIANRIEQQRLKKQFKDIGIFLQVKRGDRINKNIYSEKWQNASNDEFGQMIYSFIYQRPGSARNSKSAMLQNEDNYKMIYQTQYSNFLLLAMQLLKTRYNDWKLDVKKNDTNHQKLALIMQSYFIFMGVIGLLAKLYLNEDLRSYLHQNIQTQDLIKKDEFKRNLCQNDIGQSQIFINTQMLHNIEYTNDLFNFIYDKIVQPSFEKFSKRNPSHGPTQFAKSDTNYYNYIVSYLIEWFDKNWYKENKIINFLSKYFISDKNVKIGLLDWQDYYEVTKPGITVELTEYRRSMYRKLNAVVPEYKILTPNQISQISAKKPRTFEDLINDAKMTQEQLRHFGDDVLEIVKKYVII